MNILEFCLVKIEHYNCLLSQILLTGVCVSHSVMSHSLLIPWTIARQAPLSTEFSRQAYWNGLPFSTPNYGFFFFF